MKYVVFMCCTIKILISSWPWTQFSELLQAGKRFWLLSPWSQVGQDLPPIFLCSDWSKFDRWVHAEHLCSILKLDNFDSWSWENFVSTCDVFNCLFPLDVQNEIQLPPIYWVFGWQMRRLSKWEIQFRVASFSFFTLLDE